MKRIQAILFLTLILSVIAACDDTSPASSPNSNGNIDDTSPSSNGNSIVVEDFIPLGTISSSGKEYDVEVQGRLKAETEVGCPNNSLKLTASSTDDDLVFDIFVPFENFDDMLEQKTIGEHKINCGDKDWGISTGLVMYKIGKAFYVKSGTVKINRIEILEQNVLIDVEISDIKTADKETTDDSFGFDLNFSGKVKLIGGTRRVGDRIIDTID